MNITKRIFILSALCLSITTAKAERPNVIIIITDDQGYGDFGATGNKVIETPNIDDMATR